MKIASIALALALAVGTAACSQADDPTEAAQAHEIAWREGDVDDALAEARELGKPVILYWGAVWCPPCNQMKASLFKDPAFIAETENFVPVYLDGDTAGAQAWGERFGISGYPTVIVLQPDGTEITRIASATMASELPELLRVAAGRTTSIEALLAKAEDDTASLSADDWRILAGFDWRNDPKHFADLAKAGTLLDQLATAATDIQAEVATLEARREPARLELEERRASASRAEVERDAAAATLAAEEQAYAEAQRQIEGLEADVEAARSEVFAAVNAATALRHAMEHAAAARSRLAEEIAKLEVEGQDLRIEAERAELDRRIARRHLGEGRRRTERVLVELRLDEREGQARAHHLADLEPAQRVRQAADVVLVAVRHHDGTDPAALEVRDVGQHEVDAEMLVPWEREPGLDHDQVLAVLEHSHVLADLAEAAEGNDAKRSGHRPQSTERVPARGPRGLRHDREQPEPLEAAADRGGLVLVRLDQRQAEPADLVPEELERLLDRDRVRLDS